MTSDVVLSLKCVYLYECFYAMKWIANGSVTSDVVPSSKCVYLYECFYAVKWIANRIVNSQIHHLEKSIYVCKCFFVVNRMPIAIVISHFIPKGKCFHVGDFSSHVNGNVIGILMLSDICCPQYPLNNFQSICNCDSLLFLKVIVFWNGNDVCLLKCPLKAICCASVFSLTLNESVIGFHVFFSWFVTCSNAWN